MLAHCQTLPVHTTAAKLTRVGHCTACATALGSATVKSICLLNDYDVYVNEEGERQPAVVNNSKTNKRK